MRDNYFIVKFEESCLEGNLKKARAICNQQEYISEFIEFQYEQLKDKINPKFTDVLKWLESIVKKNH